MPENLPLKTGGGSQLPDSPPIISEGECPGLGIIAITSPPISDNKKLHHSIASLTHFGWGVLCLVAVLIGSQSFSFGRFHEQVDAFVQATKRGSVIAGQNITLGAKICLQSLSQSGGPLKKVVASRWEKFILTEKKMAVRQFSYFDVGFSELTHKTKESVAVIVGDLDFATGRAINFADGTMASLSQILPDSGIILKKLVIKSGEDIYLATKLLSDQTAFLLHRTGLAMLTGFSELERGIVLGEDKLIKTALKGSQAGWHKTGIVVSNFKQGVEVSIKSMARQAEALSSQGQSLAVNLDKSIYFGSQAISDATLSAVTIPGLVILDGFTKTEQLVSAGGAVLVSNSSELGHRLELVARSGQKKITAGLSQLKQVETGLSFENIGQIPKISLKKIEGIGETSQSMIILVETQTGEMSNRAGEKITLIARTALSLADWQTKLVLNNYVNFGRGTLAILVYAQDKMAGIYNGAETGVTLGLEKIKHLSLTLDKESLSAVTLETKKTIGGLAQVGQSAVTGVSSGGKAVVQTVAGTGETGREFVLGAGAGVQLAEQNLLASFEASQNFIFRGYNSARISIVSVFSQANREFIALHRSISGRFASRPRNLIPGRLTKTVVPKSIMSKLAEKDKNKNRVAQTALVTNTVTEKIEKGLPASSSSSLKFLAGHLLNSNLLIFPVLAYDNNILSLRTPLNRAIFSVTDTGSSVGESVALAWDNFFGGFTGDNLSNTALREQLKNEILQELSQNGGATVEDSNASSMFSSSGIVVMKPTGSSTVDLANVKKLQDAFSDRVIVNFDKDGQTGVVQPIFRNNKIGPKFQFVLTPIKQ